MTRIAIAIYREKEQQFIRLGYVDDLNNRCNLFVRSSVRENVLFATRYVCKLYENKPLFIEWKKDVHASIYVHKENEFYCVIVEEKKTEFPFYIAHQIIEDYKRLVPERFDTDQMYILSNHWLTKPNTLYQIQKEIEDVQEIMMENLTKIIERQEQLDSLKRKSDDLLIEATRFKQMHSSKCCEIM
jgi:hypothetical protein